MSRKKDIESIASLLGNSAAHVALLPESEYAQKEATTYTSDASEIAHERTWNKNDVEVIKQKALLRAKSEIKKRIKRYGFEQKNFEIYVKRAEEYIERFLKENTEKNV